jgi:hypothetical protein
MVYYITIRLYKYTIDMISKKKITQAGGRQARSSFASEADCPRCGQLAEGAFVGCADSLKLA